jgi:dethiobiotin synthase
MFLVTGTDTGVGKTFVTSSLVSFLREKNINAVAYKIVETGCGPDCEDAKKLSEASRQDLLPIYAFKNPLAPAVAADIEGVKISVDKIVGKAREISEKYDIVFFEGAGGILVPITWSFTFLDLAKTLNTEVIIVALNKLGVLNHTLLTVKACQVEGVKVRGIVLNMIGEFDESVKTNLHSLKKLLPDISVVPFRNPADSYNCLKAFSLVT